MSTNIANGIIRRVMSTIGRRFSSYLYTRRPMEKRFWQKVNKGEGCWEWTGKITDGYGQIYYRGKRRKATRVLWEMLYGDPGNLLVCHKCDNRLCVRPDHLFLGTDQGNLADRDAKGRQARGITNGMSKLNETQARILKRLHGVVEGTFAAHVFGITPSTARKVMSGAAWKHMASPTKY